MDILGYMRRKWPLPTDGGGDGSGEECNNQHGLRIPNCQSSSTSTTKKTAETVTKAGPSAADTATQTATTTTADDIVPSVGSLQTTTADNGNDATATTSNTSVLSITSSSATSTTTSSTDNQSSGGGGTSTKTKLAIAIPVAIVGALIIMGIVFFVLRRRRQQQQQKPQPVPSDVYEENAKNESNAVSTSQLMVTVPVSQPNNQREPGFPRFPMLDVPDSREGDVSPAGSAGHMSQNDGHSEVGYGMAVSRDQRPNTTEQDHRVISRSASPANALDAHVQGQQGVGNDDAVSVVSVENGTREQHYDDMSSVSSFDGDTPRADDHQHPFR